MSSSLLFLFVLGLTYDICVSQQNVCSGGDISRETDLDFADLVGKIWYAHIHLDDTGRFTKDAKLIFKFDATGDNVFGYVAGRSPITRKCETSVYHDLELGINNPCKLAYQVFPASNESEFEFIGTFLDETKTRLLFYACFDFDENNNTCNTAATFGSTTRRRLKQDEKQAFAAKIEAFGRKLPSTGLSENDIDRPAKNNCEVPTAEALGILKKQEPTQ